MLSGGGYLMTCAYACAAVSHLLGSPCASLKKSSPKARYAFGMYFEFGVFVMRSR